MMTSGHLFVNSDQRLVMMLQTELEQKAGRESLVTMLHLSTRIVDCVFSGDAAD